MKPLWFSLKKVKHLLRSRTLLKVINFGDLRESSPTKMALLQLFCRVWQWKNFEKSINIWPSYEWQEFGGVFFDSRCIVVYSV